MGISNDALLVIQFLLAIVAWLGKRTLDRIEKTQASVLIEMRTTNGKVIRLEQAIKDHDRLDESRFDELEKRMDRESG